ncbi:MAG: hypothetical protein ACTSRE_13750 [Promethearchaeota archaeon]
MTKKPHILFRLLPPIVALLVGFGFTMIHGLTTSGGGPTTTELPIDPLDLGFLIASGIVVIIFPLLSRSWVSSFLSPLLYFGALLLSSENFFGLVGLADLWVFPADFTQLGELVLYVGTGIFGVGFVSGLTISVVQKKRLETVSYNKKERPEESGSTSEPPSIPLPPLGGSAYTPDEMEVVLGFTVQIENAGTGDDPESPWEQKIAPGTIPVEPGEVLLPDELPEEEPHPFEMQDSGPAPGSEEPTPETKPHTYKELEHKSKPSEPEPTDSESDPEPADQAPMDDSKDLLSEPCATDPEVEVTISEPSKTIDPDTGLDSELESNSEPRFDPEKESESKDSGIDTESEPGPDPEPEP